MSRVGEIVKAAVASPFISYGVDEIDKKSFVNYISINMGWVPPKVAEDLLRLAFLYGFIEEIEDRIRITIDTKSISLRDFNPQSIEKVLNSSRAILDMFSLVSDPYEASVDFREFEDRYGEHLYDEAIMLLVLRKRDIEYRIRDIILKKD